MNCKILISHPQGNANTRSVLNGLAKYNMLSTFITSVALFKESWWYCFTKYGILKTFRRRIFSSEIKPFTICFPFKNLAQQILKIFNLRSLINGESSPFSSYSICKYIDKKTREVMLEKKDEIDAVYCFEDIAIDTFREAKKIGKKCIYDLPIGHYRYMHELFEEEKKKNPEWAMTLGGINDSIQKLRCKDEELRLADKIIVPSDFVRKSLSLYPEKLSKINVIPFGFPDVNRTRVYNDIMNRKIKLLYVGGLTQRKGIGYLFKALEGLDDMFELTLIGSKPNVDCPALDTYLEKYNYLGIMSHDDVLHQMTKHDIFIFPSLFEGFALVITESMSQGTPCITTLNSGIPDNFKDGENCWIVEAGNSESIRKCLVKLNENRQEIIQVSKNALQTAAQRPWNVYEDEIVKCILDN